MEDRAQEDKQEGRPITIPIALVISLHRYRPGTKPDLPLVEPVEVPKTVSPEVPRPAHLP